MSNFDSDGDFCNSICDDTYYETNGTYYPQIYNEQGNQAHQDEDYWKSPCSSDSPKYIRKFPSNESVLQSGSPTSSSFHYVPIYHQTNKNDFICDGYFDSNRTVDATSSVNFNNNIISNLNKNVTMVSSNNVPVVRVVKRRTTANKKERRRTQSINSAYNSLRDHIPNVPSDTKLSKIKTLRLATSYISYLIAVLDGEQDASSGFRAELVPSSRKINAERRAQMKKEIQHQITVDPEVRKRTGWPQSVWALGTRKAIK